MTIIIQRDVLHQAIDTLPENTLNDLARFIEFLQFKAQENERDDVSSDDDNTNIDVIDMPLFNPVYFPEGILPEFDFSPAYIKEARQEFLVGFGEGFE